MEIKNKILKILASISNEDVTSLSEDTNLLESGLLNSYDLIVFISELESSFSIKLSNADLSPANLASIAKISQLLDKYSYTE